MEEQDFKTIKAKYVELREQERRKIIDYLAGLKDADGRSLFMKGSGGDFCSKDCYRGGTGKNNYGLRRNNGFKGYDLSNWKWIDAKYHGHEVLISLQSFEIDPNAGNLHVLYDRIGLLFKEPCLIEAFLDSIRIRDAFLNMEVTDWDLPLSESDLKALTSYIMEKIDSGKV